MNTVIAETTATAISNAKLTAEWESGTRTMKLTITSAEAWAPRGDDGPVRVYLRYEIEGSRFDAPSKIWWDGDDLHVEGLDDLSSRKRDAADAALSDLEDEIIDAVEALDATDAVETAEVVTDALVEESISREDAAEIIENSTDDPDTTARITRQLADQRGVSPYKMPFLNQKRTKTMNDELTKLALAAGYDDDGLKAFISRRYCCQVDSMSSSQHIDAIQRLEAEAAVVAAGYRIIEPMSDDDPEHQIPVGSVLLLGENGGSICRDTAEAILERVGQLAGS